MNAKEYMQQIRKLDQIIENKLIEIEQWKTLATGTTSYSDGERVQTSSNQQKMADAVARYLDIQNEIEEDIDRLVDIKMDVIRTIERLKPKEYDVLHMIYVQYLTFNEVAEKYNQSYTWATTVHGRALANLQKLIDAKV